MRSKATLLGVLIWLAATSLAGAQTSASRTSTATPTATPEPVGCCQGDPASRNQPPICGNLIKQSDCQRAFGTRSHFCPGCACTSHSEPGFTFDRGECLPQSPTLTPTIALTPTATPTATPTPNSGCCQVNTSRPGPHPFICGNAVTRDSCLNDFGADATFCAECVCSTHTTPGFGTSPGSCVQPVPPGRPNRPPRPVRPPRQPRPPH